MTGLRHRWPLLLALIGGICVASVAAGTWLGKPPSLASPPVATPIVAPSDVADIAPRGMDAMTPTDPPRPLPAISFLDGDGRRHALAELRGRPVLLNLWATWCQPCIAELPALAALARDQGPDGIAVVALSTDRGGVSQVRAFLAARAIDLPIRVDPAGVAADALGARGLPTTLVIDAEGRERARFEGAADWDSAAARRTILALVAKK